MSEAILSPEAPPPAGHYSQAIRAGDFLFVSGQVPRRSDGTYQPADVATETRQVLDNLAAIAAAAGADLDHAVKITAYLADGGYFAEFNRAYAEYFGAAPPARTTVVAGLRQVKVELDAIIHLPAG